MKKKIICLVIIFCLMLIIPFFTIENKENFSIEQDYLNKKQLCELLYKDFKPEYNTETLKVLAIILQTNYTKNKSDLSYMTKDEFYNKFGEKADDYYKKIDDAVKAAYNKVVLIKDEKIHLPYCHILNSSADNSKLEYFNNVATPWDCLNAEYKSGATEGISLNTVNELCENGYTYQDALNYFLKNIKIETAP